MTEPIRYMTADGAEILPSRRYWDKNLRVVTVTALATDSNPYPGMTDQIWHRTTGGTADSYDGTDHKWGGLARKFEGRDAEAYPDGTEFSDIK